MRILPETYSRKPTSYCGARREFNEEMSFVAWACGIARFQVKARRRDMQRDKLVFNDKLLDNLAVEAETFTANDDFDRMLSDCLDELPAPQRELLLQRLRARRLAQEIGRQAWAFRRRVGCLVVSRSSSACRVHGTQDGGKGLTVNDSTAHPDDLQKLLIGVIDGKARPSRSTVSVKCYATIPQRGDVIFST